MLTGFHSHRRPPLLSFSEARERGGYCRVTTMASSPRDRFSDFMTSKGRTVTDQMARIADTALGCAGTFSYDDVVADLQGKASRATAYRTLAKMVEAGVLRRVEFNDREMFVLAVDDN